MRTSTLITSYIQAAIFSALALRCFLAWSRERERRSLHLAWAAGLFALNSLMGAVANTVYDMTKGQVAPRWESAASTVILFIAIYAFLIFLADFVRFPRWIKVLFVLATGVNVVLAAIERPDVRFDAKAFQLVQIPGVSNPISYHGYLGYALAYLAVSLAVLAVAFLGYALRTTGLARLRMLAIGSSFLLLCVVVGLLPWLLYGHPSAQTIRHLLNVLEYVALATGPLMLVGLAPPGFVKAWFRRREAPLEGSPAPVT